MFVVLLKIGSLPQNLSVNKRNSHHTWQLHTLLRMSYNKDYIISSTLKTSRVVTNGTCTLNNNGHLDLRTTQKVM